MFDSLEVQVLSSPCFSFIKRWVEKKIRRHLMRARGRPGFGWKRWSTKWLYGKLGIFNSYQVSRQRARRRPAE
jgi:RNA-directed DNA polymerase